MRWYCFFLATVCVCLVLISPLVAADEVSPKIFTSDFNHPDSGFSETYPWEAAGGELRYGGGDPEYDCDYNKFDHLVSPDFQYEIQAAWRGGDPKAGFGVLFRIDDQQGMLTFEINRQGCFQTSYIHEKWEIVLDDWQHSDAIKPEGFNKLKVICQGKSVQCYINDVLVSDCPDKGDYHQPVKVGIIVLSGVKCAFDNFLLQELPAREK